MVMLDILSQHPWAPTSGVSGYAAQLGAKPFDAMRDRMANRAQAIEEEETKVKKEVDKRMADEAHHPQ